MAKIAEIGRFNMSKLDRLAKAMMEYDRGDAQEIQHFIKVCSLSEMIGREEGLSNDDLFTLEAAAITHDIGIRLSREKYGDTSGKHQEELGPSEARALLESLSFHEETIERVSKMISLHHSYDKVEGLDLRILMEADALVNLCEHRSSREEIERVYDSVFRTNAGRAICRVMFGLD